MSTAEAVIQDATMAILMKFQPDLMYWRNNTGAVKVDNRFVRFGQKGAPDILGCYKGKAIGIECKSSTGKQKPDQFVWAERWRRAGGIYILVNSQNDIDYLEERLRNL